MLMVMPSSLCVRYCSVLVLCSFPLVLPLATTGGTLQLLLLLLRVLLGLGLQLLQLLHLLLSLPQLLA